MAKDTRINVTLDFKAEVANIQQAVQGIQKSLGNINLPPSLNKNFLTLFSNLEDEIKNFGSLSSKTLRSSGDFSAIEKSGKKVFELYRKLGIEVDNLKDLTKTNPGKFLSTEDTKKLNTMNAAMAKYRKAVEAGTSAIDKKKKALIEYEARLQTATNRQKELAGKTQVDDKAYTAQKQALEQLNTEIKEQARLLEEAEAANINRMKSMDRSTPDKRTKEYKNLVTQQERLKTLTEQQATAQTNLDNTISKSQYKAQLTRAVESQNKWTKSIEQTQQEIQELGDGGASKAFKELLKDLENLELEPDTIKSLEDLESIMRSIAQVSQNQLAMAMNDVERKMEDAGEAVEDLGDKSRDAGEDVKALADSKQEIENFKRSILDFFSIGNAVQLFKNAVRSAFETVKELDATMTEAAVVTEFSVGDMWEKLPQYSQEASQLGARINDLYGATTLYYQQGLKTNEAMGVGVETMKMARIANMDATEATTAMTAALRGFNMEVNEMNAQTVNDVYSELAAITAADTSQIATAMSKTASIAASANMEFENTAALLAQIIETTQEAPETAGTALKTIIARFSEVKKLANEGQSTGQDEEGEAIDVNKIQTALRSVGISMDDFFKGTEGLDDVLLRLAEKWDTLDFETQRYIATTAAGSRQQSRFIAMMSDYERTVELTNAANNSAGASTEQFNKTLDSLDSKLNELKNAWDTFIMGIFNNDLLKAGVDALTALLNTLNNIIDTLSGGQGIAKTFVSALIAIGAFKLGRNIFGSSKAGIFAPILENLGYVKKQTGKEGELIGKSLGTTLGKGFKKVKGIDFKKEIFGLLGFSNNITEIKKLNKSFGLNQLDFSKVTPSGLNDLKNNISSQIEKMPAEVSQNVDWQAFGLAQSAPEMTAALGPVSEQIKITGQDAANAGAQLSKMSGSMKTAGVACSVLGPLLMILSQHLKDTGAAEELTAGLDAAGTALIALGAIIPTVAQALVVAGVEVGAAWWWVTLIALAAAALIGVFVALGKAAENNSIEAQMEKARKATEAAKEAANKAKEQYDALLGDRKEYQELQDTLKNLVKGTDEWKQALLEANQQVLQLLQTYPELAKHLGRGEDGQLIIKEEGFDEVIANQQKGIKNANASVLTAQMNQNLVESKGAAQKLVESHGSLLVTGGIPVEKLVTEYQNNPELFASEKISVAEYEALLVGNEEDKAKASKIAQAWGYGANPAMLREIADEEGNITIFNDELLELANGSAQLARSFASLETDVNAYALSLQTSENTNKQLASSILSTQASQETLDYEYSDAIIGAFSGSMQGQNYQDYLDVKKHDEIYNTETDANEDSNRQEIMRNRGLNVTGDEKVDMETLYKDVMKVSEIPEDIANDYEAMADAISAALAAEEKVANLEKFRLNVQEKLTEEEQKQLAGLLSKDVSKMSMTEIAALQTTSSYELLSKAYTDENGKVDTEAMSKDLGYETKLFSDLSAEEKELLARRALDGPNINGTQITDEQIQNYIATQENQTAVVGIEAQLWLEDQQFQAELEKIREEALSKFNSKGISSLSSELYNLSPEALKNLSAQTETMTEDETKAYLSNFEELLKQVSGSAKGELANFLSTTDWSNIGQAVDAMDYLQSQGFDIEQAQAFWDNAISGAGAFNLTLSETLNLMQRFTNSLNSINDLETRLLEGKGTYKDVQDLIAAGVDISQFQYTGEGWKGSKEQVEAATGKMREWEAFKANEAAKSYREQYNAALSNGYDFITYNKETGKFSIDQYGLGQLTQVDEESGKLIGGTVTDLDMANSIADILGEAKQGDKESDADFVARIQGAYDNYIYMLNNGEEVATALEKNAAYVAASEFTADENALQGGTDESVRYSMQNEAVGAGLDSSEVTDSSEALKEIETLKNASQQLRDRLALDIALASQGAEEIVSSYEDWATAIDDGPGNPKYASSLKALTSSTSKLLGVSEEVAGQLLKEKKNRDLVAKAAKGEESALKELRKIAAQDTVATFEIDDDTTQKDIDAITDYISNTEFPTLEVGTSIDTDPAYQGFRELIEGSGLTAEQMSAALESMNFEPEIEWVPVNQDSVTKDDQTYTYTDATGATHTVKASSAVVQNGELSIPIINGNATVSKPPKPKLGGNGGGGGGGSKKSEKQHWENPYDELHNTQEALDETLRDRNQLEIDYDRILKDRTKTFKDLYENQKDQLANLEREKQLQNELLAGRKAQLANLASESYIATRRDGDEEEQFRTTFAEEFARLGLGSIDQYMGYNSDTQELWIDWDRIEAIEANETSGEDQGALIEALKDRYDEIAGQIEETEDTIYEIEDKVTEILEQGREEYEDLEQQIYDALVNERQTLIDNYSTLSETLSESSSEMLTALQESIDLERQIRDNTKQEEDIAEMEARLAYLRADTSGGNRLEALELEEQLAEARESYGNTLVDQEIERLNKANEEAAEQRERQIEIMQSQLDYQTETGYFWEQAHDLIAQLVENDGKVDPSSPLGKLLTANSDWKSMSEQQKATWVDDLEQTIMSGLAWIIGEGSSRQLEKIGGMTGKTVTFRNGKGETLTGTVNEDGSVTTSSGETYKDVVQMFNGDYTTAEETGKQNNVVQDGGDSDDGDDNNKVDPSYETQTVKAKTRASYHITDKPKATKYGGKSQGIVKTGQEVEVDGYKGDWYHTVKPWVGYIYKKAFSEELDKTKLTPFKTGGLADFTGPAWLDGTKSHPELVLNQQDTKNFIVLKDILADALGAMSGKTSAQGGDNYFDIDIIVDEIGNDYDVDQLSERIKQNIYQDGMYRNVNTISLQR